MKTSFATRWVRILPRARLRTAMIPSLVLLAASFSNAMAQDGALTVSWDPNTDPTVVEYRVYYGIDPLDLSSVVQVSSSLTSTLVTGLTPGVIYYVAVTAVRTSGCESQLSAVVSATARLMGPVITPLTPLEGETCAARGSIVSILVEDPFEAINTATMTVLVNGASVSPNIASSNGAITLSFPLTTIPADGQITIEVTASDTAVPANTTLYSYSFIVEPSVVTGLRVN